MHFPEAKKIYPDDSMLACSLELVSKLNPETFRIGFLAESRKCNLEPIDLTTMLFTQSQTPNYAEISEEIMEIFKSYPKEYDTFKKNMKKMLEILNKFNEMT